MSLNNLTNRQREVYTAVSDYMKNYFGVTN
jgi:hypothetical protein